jgi:hypothetical protein
MGRVVKGGTTRLGSIARVPRRTVHWGAKRRSTACADEGNESPLVRCPPTGGPSAPRDRFQAVPGTSNT